MTELLSQAPGRQVRQDDEAVRCVARWMPHRLFSYERSLGVREAERLGCRVHDTGAELLLIGGDPGRLVERSTFLAFVTWSDGTSRETRQAATERVHLVARSTASRRQATRYGLHGIHEYKGKFNPQIVRAICNVVEPDAEVLIDPFCGSGTALIEGLRLGLDVVGLDRSPMAVFLASTKVAATHEADPRGLFDAQHRLAVRTTDALRLGQQADAAAALDALLSPSAIDYLRKWLTPPAYNAMSRGLALLLPMRDALAARLVLTALSSIIRTISLQVPEDLRIRRRDVRGVAHARVEQGLREVMKWPEASGSWSALPGSAESCTSYRGLSHAGRRLIVTSPPYATALPYIDTDRISMVALGLVEPEQLSTHERDLTGSREWNRAQQRVWDERRAANDEHLPLCVVELLARIERLNEAGDAGFRRRAVPTLLYRYFARMRHVLCAWRTVLRAGECAALVVGHNRTTAGGTVIDIATPHLLGEIASAEGFEVVECTPLETWPRYGLHAGNGVANEDLLVLRRCG